MTVGSVGTNAGPYVSSRWKSWNGADDPVKKRAWNHYTLSAGSRTCTRSTKGYALGVSANMSSVWTSDDDTRLLDKLASKVRQHDFHAGVFIGQTHEVASSVARTATAFLGIKRSLLRGDLQGALRFLSRSVSGSDLKAAKKKLDTRDIAGTHLSLYYGWLPLLSDCQAAAEALEFVSKGPRTSTVRVGRRHSIGVEMSQSPTNYTCPGTKVSKRQLEYVMTEVLPLERNLGLTDPASVAWELAPWSTVADWFVPIGTYLSNLAIIPHLKGEWREQTKTTNEVGGCRVINQTYYAGGNSQYVETVFTRHTASSVPPSVPLPGFRGFDQLYKSSTRVANAIALVRMLYK